MPAVEQLPLLRVSEGGRRATLEILAGTSAEVAQSDALLGLARERGLVVDQKLAIALRAAAEEFSAHGGTVAWSGVVCECVPAQHGTDACIAWHERIAAGIADAEGLHQESDGSVDFRNRVRFTKVTANEVLGRILPLTEGVDGRDVCGRNIPARRGKNLSDTVHSTVHAEADGTLIATCDGVLSLAKGAVSILDEMDVKGSVDFSTGNIDFVGSVRIAEGVRDNFIVRATGDVTIKGLIEAATLLIGGDLHAPMGVAARGNGAMLVDGSLDAGYLNGLRGRVRGDAIIRRELVGCELIVGGNVKIERGAILGGTLVCGGSLVAESIGSEGGARTTIAVGCRPMQARRVARIATLSKEIAAKLPAIEDRAFQLQELGANAKAFEKEECTELAFEMAEIHRRMRALEAKRRELLLDMGLGRVVHVDVRKVLFRGTTLKVGTREIRFDHTIKGPLVIVWDEARELYIRVDSAPAQPLRDVAIVRDLAA
ncbi:MAG: DUF342 domain-containing protein [Phycisphaerales bacterium]|nr:DUF342 domain-containing protein [Phycisphaerales bacterium]